MKKETIEFKRKRGRKDFNLNDIVNLNGRRNVYPLDLLKLNSEEIWDIFQNIPDECILNKELDSLISLVLIHNENVYNKVFEKLNCIWDMMRGFHEENKLKAIERNWYDFFDGFVKDYHNCKYDEVSSRENLYIRTWDIDYDNDTFFALMALVAVSIYLVESIQKCGYQRKDPVPYEIFKLFLCFEKFNTISTTQYPLSYIIKNDKKYKSGLEVGAEANKTAGQLRQEEADQMCFEVYKEHPNWKLGAIIDEVAKIRKENGQKLYSSRAIEANKFRRFYNEKNKK